MICCWFSFKFLIEFSDFLFIYTEVPSHAVLLAVLEAKTKTKVQEHTTMKTVGVTGGSGHGTVVQRIPKTRIQTFIQHWMFGIVSQIEEGIGVSRPRPRQPSQPRRRLRARRIWTSVSPSTTPSRLWRRPASRNRSDARIHLMNFR
jgi:hypothetical protein